MTEQHKKQSTTERTDVQPRPAWRFFRRLRAARRDRRGSVAIEFALVALPFFLFLFAIIEISLLFFVGQILDNAVNTVARQIRTGQAEAAALNEQEFKKLVCQGMLGLGDCGNNLYIDVKPQTSFAAADLSSPVDENGNIKPTAFNHGGPLDIMIVRVFYTWPIFFNLLTTGIDTGDGKRILSSIVAFRNEPYR